MARVKTAASAASGNALKVKTRAEVGNAHLAHATEAVVEKKPRAKNGNGKGELGFEATLWAMADRLRGTRRTSSCSSSTTISIGY